MVVKKGSMNIARLASMLALVIYINFFISCAAKLRSIVPAPINTEMGKPPVNFGVRSPAGQFLIGRPRQDTVQKKTISATEIQVLMANAYKTNYDRFFKPEFTRLNDVIESQAKSIVTLSTTIDSVRGRSIMRNARQEKEIAKYQQLYSDLLRKQIKSAEAQTQSNNKQIAETNKVVKYLIVGWTILFLAIIGLGVFCALMYRRIKQLQKSLNYE